MCIGQLRSALATVRSRLRSRQVPNALDGRGICPVLGNQMFVARARQVPSSIDMRRASRGTRAMELGRQLLCEPLLWNG